MVDILYNYLNQEGMIRFKNYDPPVLESKVTH